MTLSSRALCLAPLLALALTGAVRAQPRPPDFSLTAQALRDEIAKDEEAANKKYLGKTIEATGVISQMVSNLYDERYISLGGVACVTTDPEPWATFAPGQRVVVQGKCTKGFAGPIVSEAVVKAIDKSPSIKVSAAELAQEFARDRKAAGTKYHEKYFVVNGKIAEIKFNDVGASSVHLDRAGEVSVVCTFDFSYEKKIKAPKAGDPFVAFGQYNRILSSKNSVELFFCLPITPNKE